MIRRAQPDPPAGKVRPRDGLEVAAPEKRMRLEGRHRVGHDRYRPGDENAASLTRILSVCHAEVEWVHAISQLFLSSGCRGLIRGDAADAVIPGVADEEGAVGRGGGAVGAVEAGLRGGAAVAGAAGPA